MDVNDKDASVRDQGVQSDSIASNGDQASSSSEENQQDVVKYSTYKKLLDQRKSDLTRLKSLEEKLNIYDTEKKTFEETQLEEKGEYRKLIERRDLEIQALNEKVSNANSQLENSNKMISDTWKLQAVYEKLPGKIKKQEYLNFVNLDSIAIDPETNKIDNGTVDQVVNDFMENHSSLVDTSSFKGIPGNAPGRSTSLSYDEWKTLPLSEMKKRMKEVMKK